MLTKILNKIKSFFRKRDLLTSLTLPKKDSVVDASSGNLSLKDISRLNYDRWGNS